MEIQSGSDLNFKPGEVFMISRKELLEPTAAILEDLPDYLRAAIAVMANHPPIKGFTVISGERDSLLKVFHVPSEVTPENRGRYEATQGIAQLCLRMLESEIEWQDIESRTLQEAQEAIIQDASQDPQVKTYAFFNLID